MRNGSTTQSWGWSDAAGYSSARDASIPQEHWFRPSSHPTLIPLPACASEKSSSRWPRCLHPIHRCERSRWNCWFLAFKQPFSGQCGHLGSKPTSRRALFSLSLSKPQHWLKVEQFTHVKAECVDTAGFEDTDCILLLSVRINTFD